MLGDIKIALQPGFGSMMQDLARQPLDETNSRLATPAAQAPSAEPHFPEMPAGSFIPSMLPLPSNTMQRVAEPDRRTRNLADIRAAFQAFDETADEPSAIRSSAQRAPDDIRDPAPANAAAQPQHAGRQTEAMFQGPTAQDALRMAGKSSNPPSSVQTPSLRQVGETSTVRSPLVDSLQASVAATAVPRRPASSQPFLVMFASATVAFAVAWLMMKFI